MEHQLLVPFDGSDQAMRALEYALEVFPEADITVLHVLDPSEWIGYAGMEGGTLSNFDELQSQREDEARALLDDARETADANDAEVTTVVRTGTVPATVIDYADENDVDHVIIGSHGRTGASRILLGSIAEKIVRRSPLPVTVI